VTALLAVVEKYEDKQVNVTAAALHVAAPVPVQATQVPTVKKYPLLQVLGIGPVVHVAAPRGHAVH